MKATPAQDGATAPIFSYFFYTYKTRNSGESATEMGGLVTAFRGLFAIGLSAAQIKINHR